MCDLQGRTRTEAAAPLAIPEGTLSSRLNGGRKKVAARLARRGFGLPADGLAAVLSGSASAVPRELPGLVIEAAFAKAGDAAVAANVRFLATEGGSAVGNYRVVAAVVATVGLAVGGATAWPGDKPGGPVQQSDVPKLRGEVAGPSATARPTSVGAARVRLTNTAALWTEAGQPVWSPDGRKLAVMTAASPLTRNASVFEVGDNAGSRELPPSVCLGPPKAETPDARPSDIVGFVPGKPWLVTTAVTRGNLNANRRLLIWDVSGRKTSVSKAVKEVPMQEDDGRPFAVSADGQSVWCLAEHGVNALNLTTGEVGPTVAATDFLCAAGFSRDRRVLVTLADRADKGVEVAKWDASTNRREWVRTIRPSRFKCLSRQADQAVWVSADGAVVAVSSMYATQPDESKNISSVVAHDTWVLKGRTGETGATLYTELLGAEGFSLSDDGRLFTGLCFDKLVVWDTASGEIVKKWSTPLDRRGTAVFAPHRPLLAVIETYTENEQFGSVKKSALGLWDLSPLVSK